jgi:hypothetical protein
MDFSTMNVEEIITYFIEKYESGEKMSLDELRDSAKACSVNKCTSEVQKTGNKYCLYRIFEQSAGFLFLISLEVFVV